MPSKNLIKIECAGSGKTWNICHTAMSIVSGQPHEKIKLIC